MARPRLHVVTGAPGAGKSTVVAALARRRPGFVVFDMDALLDAASRLAGLDLQQPAAAPRWPAYDDVWLHVAAAAAATHHVVLFGPIVPSDLDGTAVGELFDSVAWFALDCSDEARRARLAARGWDETDIEAALVDAAEVRALSLPSVAADVLSPDEVAARIADWAG